jgi:Kdo2-lipid IVA lauroyltransferase/acyltransferase
MVATSPLRLTSKASARRPRAGGVVLGALAPIGLLLAWLPSRVGLWVGRRLGDLAWALLRGRRAMAIANLARGFGGERTDAERARIARSSFQHLGMNLVESCVFFFRPPAVLLARVELRDAERLHAGAAEGRGVLLLSGHFGNWELLAASHALTGRTLSVVMRPLDAPLLDRLVARFRLRTGAEFIAKRHGLRDVLDALRRGRMVGVLLDQNASRSEGVFVPFFGIPASTSKSLALIALRTRTPVVPVFIRRLPDGRHSVEVDPPVEVPPDGDVVAYTAAFNRAVETAIRRAPEQWLWLHDRWKTRPPGDHSAPLGKSR